MNLRKKKEKENLFSKVRDSIRPVRKQGDPPEEDLEDMDAYVCDLCLVTVKRSEITQCPFCGRWVCLNDCYNDDELCCRSCAGVIRLMRESIVLGDMKEVPGEEEEKKKE